MLAHVGAFDSAHCQRPSSRLLYGIIRFLVGQPLRGESWPFESAAIEHVVEEDGVLLPYFVLLVDDLVLNLFLVLHLAGVERVYSRVLATCLLCDQSAVSCVGETCSCVLAHACRAVIAGPLHGGVFAPDALKLAGNVRRKRVTIKTPRKTYRSLFRPCCQMLCESAGSKSAQESLMLKW